MFIISVIQIVQDAMTDLFEKYKTMMQSLAYSILKDHQLSEDAVQEALIRLSRNKDKIGNIDSKETKSYIYTVTKNEALRLAQKEKTRKNLNIIIIHCRKSFKWIVIKVKDQINVLLTDHLAGSRFI